MRGGGDDSSAGGGRRRGRRGGNPFGGGRGGRRGGGGGDSRYKLEFTDSARNIFNRTNLSSPVGNLRSLFFGQSLSTRGRFSRGGNRTVELEVQFEF